VLAKAADVAVESLPEVATIRLQIDTTFQSIHHINEYLPMLRTLVLDNSTVSTIRDLGVRHAPITL
jgi:hypothetical protein